MESRGALDNRHVQKLLLKFLRTCTDVVHCAVVSGLLTLPLSRVLVMCFIQTYNCFPLAQLLLSSCQPASDQLEINCNEEGSFLFLEFFFLAIHIGVADGAIVGSVFFLSGHPLLGGIASGGSWRYRSSRWCVQPKPFLHPFQSPCIMMNNCASKLQKSTYICIYMDLILELNLEVSANYLLFEVA